eukprot:2332053-Pyramimonas_sp.AAC.1
MAAEIMASLIMGLVDNAPCEANHASIRRLIHILGAQTHRPNFRSASAKWSIRKLSRHQCSLRWYKQGPRPTSSRKRGNTKVGLAARGGPSLGHSRSAEK